MLQQSGRSHAGASSGDTSGVCAVVVTFNPKPDDVRALVAALTGQIGGIVIVDNASAPHARAALGDVVSGNGELIELHENVGVASAQNRGIAWARERGYEYVILFDQDSEPAADMVSKLLRAHVELSGTKRVSAAGPRYVDRDRGFSSYLVQFGPLGFRKVRCDAELKRIEADFLISSGALISLQTLDEIGGMDDTFFIDHVDTEWFLRARAKGHVAIGVCDAEMRHSLGGQTIRIPVAPNRNIAIHSPVRDYYMFRNSILLMKRPYVPNVWRVSHASRMLSLFVVFMVFVPQRALRLRMIARGVLDGIRNRSGELAWKG